MFNIGVGEITVILIAALVLLGPERLPEAARTLGKLYREFRKQTDEVRGVVLREFYKMEREFDEEERAQAQAKKVEAAAAAPPGEKPAPAISILPAAGAVARGSLKVVEPAPVVSASAPEAPAPAASEPATQETGS